jgi:hypothetical protein
MVRITALTDNWCSLFVRLADPRRHIEAIPLPPAVARRPRGTDPSRRADAPDHQPSPRRDGLSGGDLSRDRGLSVRCAELPSSRVP